MGRESASYYLTLPPELEDAVLVALREGGAELGTPAQRGWSLRLEEDYGRRRAEFVGRVGDINAPISADHVYMYIHQTGMRRDDAAELEWVREREIAKIEEMWAGEPELPPDHPDELPPDDAGGTRAADG